MPVGIAHRSRRRCASSSGASKRERRHGMPRHVQARPAIASSSADRVDAGAPIASGPLGDDRREHGAVARARRRTGPRRGRTRRWRRQQARELAVGASAAWSVFSPVASVNELLALPCGPSESVACDVDRGVHLGAGVDEAASVTAWSNEPASWPHVIDGWPAHRRAARRERDAAASDRDGDGGRVASSARRRGAGRRLPRRSSTYRSCSRSLAPTARVASPSRAGC